MSVGQMRILGIDVAKAKLDIALLLPDGQFRSGGHSQHAGIYLEAAAAFLAEQGHAVSVVNPAQISAFGSAALEPHKTDKKEGRRSGSRLRRKLRRFSFFSGKPFGSSRQAAAYAGLNPRRHESGSRKPGISKMGLPFSLYARNGR